MCTGVRIQMGLNIYVNGVMVVCDVKNPDIPRYSAFRRSEEKKKNEEEEGNSYIYVPVAMM